MTCDRPAWAACLDDPERWGGWALDHATALAVARHLEEARPRLLLEAGSGSSTVLLSQYADACGAQLVSLDTSPVFAGRTAALLDGAGTGRRTRIVQAALTVTDDGPWYSTALPEGIDFALVDGPRQCDGGRLAALGRLLPHMVPGGSVILDDADRPKEQADLREWERRYQIPFTELAGSAGGAAVGRLPAASDCAAGASRTVVSVLTGRRPGHLEATLARVRLCAPGLLENAQVIALHNGGDPETARVLDGHDDVIDVRWSSSDLVSIGSASSVLALQVQSSGRPFWLHLEDDWSILPVGGAWLARAQELLEEDARIGQVRLRAACEPVLGTHMVTGKPLAWVSGPGVRICPDAHYTSNPSLVRTGDAGRIWPANGECQAQRHAYAAGLRGVAQLDPGVFVHTGGDASLRLSTRCPA